jgi:endonuclease YncB( thermonuclease family)
MVPKVAGGLLLLGVCVFALEPKEIYDRGAPATVLIETDRGHGAGVLLDAARGLILTNNHVVEGAGAITVELKPGARKTAKLKHSEANVDLALLEIGDCGDAAVSAVELAPLIKNADDLKATRVYAIGHPADPTGTRSTWKFTHGLVGNVRPLAVKELDGLVLIEHDATLASGNSGGPLLDAKGRLVGVNNGGWSALSTASANTYYAIPVNAIVRYLERAGEREASGPWDDALPVRQAIAFPDAAAKIATAGGGRERAGAKKAPKGLRYGPYVHYHKSRAVSDLKKRVDRLFRHLRGLFYECPRCKGKGTIEVLLEAAYYDAIREVWVPAVYETKTCPRCDGEQKLFRAGKAQAFVAEAFSDRYRKHSAYAEVRASWVDRLKESGRAYARGPKIKTSVEGLYGTVRGSKRNPLFPLQFRLEPVGGGYEWFLHDSELAGAFRAERDLGVLPAGGKVTAVWAGDIIELDGKHVVRLCGIAIPGPKGKLPKSPVAMVNTLTRNTVATELLGKIVEIGRDKYSTITLDGHPIAYIEIDGKDYGEGLLRRGLVRKHPVHAHERKGTYIKAETEAKKAGAGIWAK